jgi:hypothetical protein
MTMTARTLKLMKDIGRLIDAYESASTAEYTVGCVIRIKNVVRSWDGEKFSRESTPVSRWKERV